MKNAFFILMFCLLGKLSTSQFLITGHVRNASESLPGAHVQLVNTQLVTTTDAKGNFSFRLPKGSYQLKISFVGYKTIFKSFSVLDKEEELEIVLYEDAMQLAALEIISTRVTNNSAMTSSMVDSAAIANGNLGTDLPYLMDQTPSVVVTSDAGNGIGYSGIRIRGSDPTRVNVSINGIPVNDAESQGVYWVDFPDLASSSSSIQIQRGAGTSANGAGAFGGTVNISTADEMDKPFAEISNSYGSFRSHKHTLKMGTGKLFSTKGRNYNYFSFDGRLSWIGSDGYIDRASSDLKSFYLSGAFISKNSSLRLIAFSGKEKTYQAWGGVPKDTLATNRTFNPYTYENETDNYIQSNYQLLYNFRKGTRLKGNVSLHYTKGEGYYEQFRESESFSDYDLADVIVGNDTISNTDLIRRRWLKNDFFGTVYSINYQPGKNWDIVFGGAWNEYLGNHFGEIIWAQWAANSEINHEYYRDDARKMDWNNFVKVNYWITPKWNAYVDLQVRNVIYSFKGFDRNFSLIDQKSNLIFFNPKLGLTYYLPKNQLLYGSFAMASKEPNRDDFTASSINSRPKPESMMDFELGYKLSSLKWNLNLNLYHMQYKDQLVLTGKINDVGSYTRQNISDSYRQGIELETGYQLTSRWNISVNATFSNNKILNYTEYIDNWDTWGQDSVTYAKTDISFSPSIIAGGRISYKIKASSRGAFKFLMVNKNSFQYEFTFSLLPKFVGKQYIDNTSSTDRMLDAYFVTDTQLSFVRKRDHSGRYIALNFMLRNLFNEMYSSNAWSYTYSYGGQQYSDMGFYPQAGINYLLGLTLGF